MTKESTKTIVLTQSKNRKIDNGHIISYTNMAFERRILGKELFPTIREGS
jgi:hypothetical protein